MHFSHLDNSSGTKFTKIAIVTALHVAVGLAVLNMKVPPGPDALKVTDIVLFTPKEPPPTPPDPPKPVTKPVVRPAAVRPPVEVVVPQQPVEQTIQTTEMSEPVPADPGPVTPAADPAPAVAPAQPGTGMRTAVLANANDCALPDYPARAARNGESGTVSLALLVGPDGRVADSRVQKTSGSRELDRAAQAALSLCKFKPATDGGIAQSAWAQIAYVWTLDG